MNGKERITEEVRELLKEGVELHKKFSDREKAPDVKLDYQVWYSKALRAVEWLAPDRYEEFRRYYEPDPKRKSLGYGTYVIQDYFKGVAPGHFQLTDFDCRGQAASGQYNQLTILSSIFKRIDTALDDIQMTLAAELVDDELETATALVKVSARAAGALAGVVLESHLQKIAERHGVKIPKKSPALGDLNDPLKNAAVYDTATWRKISYLADLRNVCCHKKAADPSLEQASELIEGVRWAVKNIS